MPLQKGSSQAVIGANIAELIKAGHSRAQAAAIAYKTAGEAQDMAPDAWKGLISGLMKFFGEEEKEPEHAAMSPEEWKGLLHGLLKFLTEEKSEPAHKSANDAMGQDSMPFERGDDANRTKTEDGRLIVKMSNISKANVCPYFGKEIPNFEDLGLDPDKKYYLYRDPVELKKGAPTFDKVPLLIRHKSSTADNHPKEVTVGTIGDDVKFNAPYLQASLAIWDGEGVKAVESRGQYQLSCGYRYDADMTPGKTPDGVPYDGVMRNIRGNHVALVEDGRAGDDVVVGDSMEIINMSKSNHSRAAAVVKGALLGRLPKLAMDSAKVDSLLSGITSANFKDRKAAVVLGVKGLAQDADVESLTKLLDALEPDAGGEDAETVTERSCGVPASGVREFLSKKLNAEDMKAYDKMCSDKSAMDAEEEDKLWVKRGQEARDRLGRDETSEEREKREREESAKAAKDRLGRDETPEEVKEREERDRQGRDRRGARDSEASKGGTESPVTKAAMDSAIATAVRAAETATVARMNDTAAAKALVEPLVGKIVIAMDSAEAVYSSTLKSLGIATDGINCAGMKTIIQREIDHKSKSGRRPVAMAQDASGSTTGLASAAKSLGITLKSVRTI